ncbi:MAG: hypothetical protein ACU833_03290, partial [Gammaproteobacteria bacterium]
GNEVHIHSPQPDVIRIPLQRIRDKKTGPSIRLYQTNFETRPPTAGFLERIELSQGKLFMSGWAMSGEQTYAISLASPQIVSFEAVPRPDVVRVTGDEALLFSGFNLVLSVTDNEERFIRENGLCLFSLSSRYGPKELARIQSDPRFDCKNWRQ